MRRLVFGLGGLQVLVTTALLAGIVAAAGQQPAQAIILGASLSLSSTAIVLELLSNQERLTSKRRPRQLFRAAGAGPRRHPDPDVRFAPAGGHRRLGARSLRHGAAAGRDRACRDRCFRPRADAAAVPAGGDDALARSVHRRRAVRDRRRRRDRQPGRPVDGARRLRRRAACWPKPNTARRSRPPSSRSRGCCSAFSFSPSAWRSTSARLLREPLLIAARCRRPDRGQGAAARSGSARLFRLPWPVAVETGLLLGPGGEFAFVGIGMAAAARLIDPRRRELHAGGHGHHDGADAAAVVFGPALRRAAARRPACRPPN